MSSLIQPLFCEWILKLLPVLIITRNTTKKSFYIFNCFYNNIKNKRSRTEFQDIFYVLKY